jgi:membrane protease YdiL (CAAX protease family)
MSFEFTLFPKVREFRAKQALGMLIAYSLSLVAGGLLIGALLNTSITVFDGGVTAASNELIQESPAKIAGLKGIAGKFIGISVIVLLLKIYCKKFSRSDLLFALGLVPTNARWVLGASIFSVALVVFCAMVLEPAFPYEGDRPEGMPRIVSRAELWVQLLWVVNVVILAPLNEEVLFRGAIYMGLLVTFGKVGSGILTTLLFAVVHFTVFTQTHWVEIFALMTISTALLFVRIKSNSLFPCMAMHAAFNLTVLGLVSFG